MNEGPRVGSGLTTRIRPLQAQAFLELAQDKEAGGADHDRGACRCVLVPGEGQAPQHGETADQGREAGHLLRRLAEAAGGGGGNDQQAM